MVKSEPLSPVAMAEATVEVSDLAGVEKIAANTPPNEVAFVLKSDASLKAAAKMKVRVRAGVDGYPLRNLEVLDCKYWAWLVVEENIEESLKEIDEIDLLIETLQEKLRAPVETAPQRGGPLAETGRGVCHVILPESRYGDYPEYDLKRPAMVTAYASEAEQAAARNRDIQSQHAYWNLNISVLQAKKRVLKEKERELETALRAEMKHALEDRTLLGAGYADCTFLCHKDDLKSQKSEVKAGIKRELDG